MTITENYLVEDSEREHRAHMYMSDLALRLFPKCVDSSRGDLFGDLLGLPDTRSRHGSIAVTTASRRADVESS